MHSLVMNNSHRFRSSRRQFMKQAAVAALASSAAGDYTVTYNITASGSCSNFSTSTDITIFASAKASISYPNSPYCTLHDTAMISFAGTPGGTFSSTPGLSIDPVTGTVDILSSTPGSYIVTYTLPPSPCNMISNTAYITLDAAVCRPIVHSPNNVNAGHVNIYPNPVQGKTINLQFTGMSEGNYVLKLINANGNEVQSNQIVFKGGNAVHSIKLGNTIIKGYYHLEIIHPDGTSTTQKVVVAD